MDNRPHYVLKSLKLLAEFSFNFLLKIKLYFYGVCSCQPPVAAVSTLTGKHTRELIAWAGVPTENGSVMALFGFNAGYKSSRLLELTLLFVAIHVAVQ